MQEQPLISIVVILNDFFHLANITLKSIINQTDKNYEIIVLETAETKRDLIMLKPFLEKIKIIKHVDEKDLSQMMNKGLGLAKGKYLHFLFSGDVYVSKYEIAYLKKLIEEKKFPDLVCCSFLRREEISPPEVVSFSLRDFKNGKIPMNIQSCWLLIDTVKKLNGFDSKYKIQSGFDLICKIFLKKGKKIIFSNRILSDSQIKKRPSQVTLYIGLETLKIIYKNFGFVKTFFWKIVRDHIEIIKILVFSLKKYFWSS